MEYNFRIFENIILVASDFLVEIIIMNYSELRLLHVPEYIYKILYIYTSNNHIIGNRCI